MRLPGCTGVATGPNHIILRSAGGTNDPSNLEPACAHCQSVQGGRLAGAARPASVQVGSRSGIGPRVVRLVGAPASGKTHLRNLLATRLGISSFGIDDERVRLLRPSEVWPEDDAPAWARLRRAATTESPCIIETSGLSWSDEWLYDGIVVFTVLCQASPEERRRRLIDRVERGERLTRTRDYVAKLMALPDPAVQAAAVWSGIGPADNLAAEIQSWLTAALVGAA